jgi:hypothetical protein
LSGSPQDGLYLFPKVQGVPSLPALAVIGGCLGMDADVERPSSKQGEGHYRVDGWRSKDGSVGFRLHVRDIDSTHVVVSNKRNNGDLQVVVSVGNAREEPVQLTRTPLRVRPLLEYLKGSRAECAATVELLGRSRQQRPGPLQKALSKMVQDVIDDPPTVPHPSLIAPTPVAIRIIEHGLTSDRRMIRAAMTDGLNDHAARGIARHWDVKQRISALRTLIGSGPPRVDHLTPWVLSSATIAASLDGVPQQTLQPLHAFLVNFLSTQRVGEGVEFVLRELPGDHTDIYLRAALRTKSCRLRQELGWHLGGATGDRNLLLALVRQSGCSDARHSAALQLARVLQNSPDADHEQWKVALRAFRSSRRCVAAIDNPTNAPIDRLAVPPSDGVYGRIGYSDFVTVIYRGCIGFSREDAELISAKTDPKGNFVTRWKDGISTLTFVFEAPAKEGASTFRVLADFGNGRPEPISLIRSNSREKGAK